MCPARPRLVACPLGFDERFAIRAVIQLRLGLEQPDAMIVFLPRNGDPRGLEAFERIKRMVENYNLSLDLRLEEVDVDDFWAGAGQVRRALDGMLKERGPSELWIIMGGGMRIMLIQVLLGVLALGEKCQALVFREDLKGSVSFPLDVLELRRPSPEHIKLLKAIWERPGLSLSELSREISMPKATLHKRIQDLARLGLVDIKHEGRRTSIMVAPKGKLWL